MNSENGISTDSSKVRTKDAMNNEITSTSDDRQTSNVSTAINQFNEYYSTSNGPINSQRSSNEQQNCIQSCNDQQSLSQNRYEYSTITTAHTNSYNGVQNDLNSVQNSLSNMDLSQTQVPIVGYEVMEERARFTIFKLKVEDPNGQSWLVFRRYTDFVRLYSRMRAESPGVRLPLPGKRWFRDNFEPAFLEERVRGLQLFVDSVLRRLPDHPVVREFFCLDEPPQMLAYQPEVQAVCGAMEDSISSLKTQLKQKDATILYLQRRLLQMEGAVADCERCGAKGSS